MINVQATVGIQDAPGSGSHLLTSTQIFNKCVYWSVSQRLGTKLTSLTLELIVESVRRAILVEIADQVHKRGIDDFVFMEDIQEITRSVTCEVNGSSVAVSVSDGWFDKVDVLLRNRTCQVCLFTVTGRCHPESECRLWLVSDLMEM
jgi:hypothetical protein